MLTLANWHLVTSKVQLTLVGMWLFFQVIGHKPNLDNSKCVTQSSWEVKISVITVYPLGTLNACTELHSNPANIWCVTCFYKKFQPAALEEKWGGHPIPLNISSGDHACFVPSNSSWDISAWTNQPTIRLTLTSLKWSSKPSQLCFHSKRKAYIFDGIGTSPKPLQ